MSSQEAEDQKKILGSLIDDLCKAGKTTLDEVKLKQIKNICKYEEFQFLIHFVEVFF